MSDLETELEALKIETNSIRAAICYGRFEVKFVSTRPITEQLSFEELKKKLVITLEI